MSIHKILKKYEDELLSRQLIDDEMGVRYYADLLRNVLTQELEDELNILETKLDTACDIETESTLSDFSLESDEELMPFEIESEDDHKREVFKILTKARYDHIKNTGLNYTVQMDSPTNRLYNELFDYFFKEDKDRFTVRLNVLCPDVKNYLQIDCTAQLTTYENVKRHVPSIEKNIRPLTFDDLQDLNFSQIVIDADTVLSVKSVVNKKYGHLQKITQILEHEHPRFYKKIMTHNDEIEDLYQRVKFVNDNGITPGQAIDELRKQLIRGGEKVTGEELASTNTIKAILKFHNYLNMLPPEMKNGILKLSDNGVNTLQNTITSLSNNHNQCVEQAATSLGKILKNANNKQLLTALPKINTEKLNQLISEIVKIQVSEVGKENCDRLPLTYLSAVISQIELYTPYELGDFLSNFNDSMYELIIKNLMIVPINKISDVGETLLFLVADQQLAFFRCLLSRLKILTHTSGQFGELLSHFDASLMGDFIKLWGRLPLNSYHDLRRTVAFFNPDQKKIFFREIRDEVKKLLNSLHELERFLIEAEIPKRECKTFMTTYLGAEWLSSHIQTLEEVTLIFRWWDVAPENRQSCFFEYYDFEWLKNNLGSVSAMKPMIEWFMVPEKQRMGFILKHLGTKWLQDEVQSLDVLENLLVWCDIPRRELKDFLRQTFGRDWLKNKFSEFDRSEKWMGISVASLIRKPYKKRGHEKKNMAYPNFINADLNALIIPTSKVEDSEETIVKMRKLNP